MPLAIAQLGQPVLRRVADPVPLEAIRSLAFQELLAAMQLTMEEIGGAGLAAPQVFVSSRVFLALAEGADERGLAVFINPTLAFPSPDMESDWEGCLSFPELAVLVPRHARVRVSYWDQRGEEKSLELNGLAARVVQHEYDHLDGILTIDRAASTRDIIKASELNTVRQLDGPDAPRSA